MTHRNYHPASWSLGTRLSATTFFLTGAIVATLIAMISFTTSRILQERAMHSVATELHGMQNTVEMFDKSVGSQARSFGRIFRKRLSGDFELDTATTIDIHGKATPELRLDGKVVNMDFALPDAFTADTGANATIFAVDGEDFVRVSTSVQQENGERAVGTSLSRNSPAYAVLRKGGTYIGLATLYGKQFITQYEPARDASGRVVAVLYEIGRAHV